jgi:phosphocarrier protein FPr/phosphocarrier protein
MTIAIASPLTGWTVSLADVPDPVFADRMLGDGVAIDPVEGRLVAPGNGRIVSIHPAGHAVTIALDAGPVLLIHIGLETVGLGGAGFTPQVKEGVRVTAGEVLIEFDLDQLARTAKSLITPVIVTNGEAFAPISLPVDRETTAGEPLMEWRISGAQAVAEAATEIIVSRSLDLPLAHGLHARPAARIAQLAASRTGIVEIVSPSGRSASAKSAVAMLALALRHGDAITVRGSDSASVDAVAELLASGMGEFQPVVPVALVGMPEAREMPGKLKGVTAVPGIVIGPAFRLRDQLVMISEPGQGSDHERLALDGARDRIRAELQRDAEGQDSRADIAAAHLVLLDDPELDRIAQEQIAAGKSAGFAWSKAIAGFVELLGAASDARLRERADDLADLRRRVIAALDGDAKLDMPPAGAIVVADELFPSQLMAFADAGISGIATVQGGTTSHVAIIAAGMGLPMLVSLGDDLGLVVDGTPLVIDGGALLVGPDDATVARVRSAAAERQARRNAAMARAHETAITTDGTRIEVFANLGSVADARAAVAEGAEGCGLLRTEFLFLDRAAPPDGEEQRATYQAIADALGPRPLIVRTLDIGADKPARWLPIAAEENPALGLRGIRLQLARTDLLESQFRALLGVRSEGPLRIMLPMVADRDELIAARFTLERLATAMGVAAPELGIMVETPAAALTATTLAADAAFFSIGTNDLSQYALARDRTNAAVAAGLDGLHPAVLRLIAETVTGGDVHGRWTGVCGGLAAESAAVPLLIGLGVTELSVPGAVVAETKALVRTLSLSDCRSIAAQALTAPDAAAVRTLVAPLLEQAA